MEQKQMMQQLQQLVMAAMQGDQLAQQQIMQVKQAAEQGDQQAAQIMQVITQIMQSMQGNQQPQMARHGAKLLYIKSLRGCPEGTEAQYFKSGGKVCKKCVETAKCGKKMKKAEEGTKMSGTTKTVSNIRQEIGKRSGKKMPSTYDDAKHERLAGLTNPTPAQKDSLDTYRKQFKNMTPAQRAKYEKSHD